jgi:enamine deaminase RidA (YjgF/YER057c/UK114 family)
MRTQETTRDQPATHQPARALPGRAPQDFEAQTSQALDNLAATLIEAGSDLDQVLKPTVYACATDRSDLVRVWLLGKPVEEG